MCGIVGMVSKLQYGFIHNDSNIFSQMLVADSVRGTDGTGVFGTYGTGSIGWLKVGAHPYALLSSKKYDSWTTAMTRKFDMVVGHNRKATAGSRNNENAHPFIHDHIILVHNGTVNNHQKMADTEVDSHAIAHSIVEKGHEETIASLQGAFALVWFDMKSRMLHMVRNDQRPLFTLETDTQFVLASEGEMLRWIGERNNKTGWDKAKLLEAGTLLSISQLGKKITTSKVKLYSYKSTSYSRWPHSYATDPEYADYMMSDELREMIAENREAESDDPITAAIQEDFPELPAVATSQEIQEVSKFLDTYKDGAQVLFKPTSLKPWSSNNPRITGYNLEGTLRSDDTVTVRASFEGSNAYPLVKELENAKVLKGVVYGAMVHPATGLKSLHVKYVTTLQTYRTFNGTLISADEWVHMCDIYKCTGCNSKLKISDVEITSVNIKSTGYPRIHCPVCVRDHMKKLPQEQQDELIKNNGSIKQLLTVTDKAWDLRGSAHGS